MTHALTVHKLLYPLDVEADDQLKCSSCIWNSYVKKLEEGNDECPKACSIIQYNTRVMNRHELIASKYFKADYFRVKYYFSNPPYSRVFHEYVIMPEISLIGNVGGTLGMFIGFSFSGLMAFMISLCKNGKK